MNKKEYLKTISTMELIEELDSRDLMAELGEEKAEYLKKEGILQTKAFNFASPIDDPKNPYSFRYLKETPVETLKEKREKHLMSVGKSKHKLT